jgi:hypothetical protein
MIDVILIDKSITESTIKLSAIISTFFLFGIKSFRTFKSRIVRCEGHVIRV